MPADLRALADSGFTVLDITKNIDRTQPCPFLDPNWKSPLPGLSYRTVDTTGADGTVVSTTYLVCKPRNWALHGDRFLVHDSTLLATNSSEIIQLLAPDLPSDVISKCRLTCMAVLPVNLCLRQLGDGNCCHGGYSETRRAGICLPNLWSVGAPLPRKGDVASTEAYRAWAQKSLDNVPGSVLPWYTLPLVGGSVAEFLSGGSRKTIEDFMVDDAKKFAANFMLGRIEVAASNDSVVHPVVNFNTSVVASVANGSPAPEAAELARSQCPLFRQLGDNTPAANLALLRWLTDVTAALCRVVIDQALEGDDLNAATLAALTKILADHPAPAGFDLSDVPKNIEDFLLDNMDWSPSETAFHAGAVLDFANVRDAFLEFHLVASQFANTTGYLARQQTGDGTKTPTAARRLALPEQPPVPDEVKNSSEGFTSSAPADFITKDRSHLQRSVNYPTSTTATLVGSTNTLFAAASSASAGGGLAPSTSTAPGPAAGASASAPHAAEPTQQDLRMDRLERSFEMVIASLQASDAARAKDDAAAATAVLHDRAQAEQAARTDLRGHPPQTTLATMQTDHHGHLHRFGESRSVPQYRQAAGYGRAHEDNLCLAADDGDPRHLHRNPPLDHAGRDGVGGVPGGGYYHAGGGSGYHTGGGVAGGGRHSTSDRPEMTAGYEPAHFSQRQQGPHHTFADAQPQVQPYQHPHHPYTSGHGVESHHQHDLRDLGNPGPGRNTVPIPFDACGNLFANQNIGTAEETVAAFGEFHELVLPLVFAAENCEANYYNRSTLLTSHQQSMIVKIDSNGGDSNNLRLRLTADQADTKAWSSPNVNGFCASEAKFNLFSTSYLALCNALLRPMRFGSLQYVVVSASRDFGLSLALFVAQQLQAGVVWADIGVHIRNLFTSFSVLRTFCEQRSSTHGKVWFHIRLLAYLSHVGASATPWIDDGVRDTRAISVANSMRSLELAQKTSLAKLASDQAAAIARMEKATAAAATAASKTALSAAAARRRDQRPCRGCSVVAGAERATLCHLNEGSRCPNADRSGEYPSGGYKKTK
jgi:hypothetical protein